MFIMRNSWEKSCLPLVLEFRMIKSFQMADTKNSAEKMKEIRKKFTKETASD